MLTHPILILILITSTDASSLDLDRSLQWLRLPRAHDVPHAVSRILIILPPSALVCSSVTWVAGWLVLAKAFSLFWTLSSHLGPCPRDAPRSANALSS